MIDKDTAAFVILRSEMEHVESLRTRITIRIGTWCRSLVPHLNLISFSSVIDYAVQKRLLLFINQYFVKSNYQMHFNKKKSAYSLLLLFSLNKYIHDIITSVSQFFCWYVGSFVVIVCINKSITTQAHLILPYWLSER